MPARYPALAGVEDLEARLGRRIEGDDAFRAEAVLDSVSIKVRKESGRLWLVLDTDGALVEPWRVMDIPDLPETVWDITVTAAERAMRNPDGYSSESAGDYSYQRVGIPGGVGGTYLTDAEIETLRDYRPSVHNAVSGLWTLGVTRNEYADQTIWFDTRPGTQPMAVDSISDFPLS